MNANLELTNKEIHEAFDPESRYDPDTPYAAEWMMRMRQVIAADRRKRDPLAARIVNPLQDRPVQAEQSVIKAAVDRFLGWRLPDAFYPDCGISFNRNMGYWPVGTNLFSAVQATEMFEYCLQGATVQPTEAQGERRDAERYRYIRNKGAFVSFGVSACDHDGDTLVGDILDNAVDKAIGALKSPEAAR